MSDTHVTGDNAPSWAIRLEGKVDLALTENRLHNAAHNEKLDDHEARLRVIENTPTVTPRGLLTAVASGVAITTGILTVIERSL